MKYAVWLSVASLLLALVAGAVVCARSAEAEDVVFETPREEHYFTALQNCAEELEVTKRRLEGEVKKVNTTTVTVNLSCPTIPPCPACPSCDNASCLWYGIGGAAIGVLGAGAACAFSGKDDDPAVIIAR